MRLRRAELAAGEHLDLDPAVGGLLDGFLELEAVEVLHVALRHDAVFQREIGGLRPAWSRARARPAAQRRATPSSENVSRLHRDIPSLVSRSLTSFLIVESAPAVAVQTIPDREHTVNCHGPSVRMLHANAERARAKIVGAMASPVERRSRHTGVWRSPQWSNRDRPNRMHPNDRISPHRCPSARDPRRLPQRAGAHRRHGQRREPLAAMEHGAHARADGRKIDIAGVMLSIASPGAYFGDVEFTRGLVRDCNEALARMVADRPTKLGAMGFVPLPDVAAAVREVDYALDVLELDGINLLTHTGDRYLGHPGGGRALCRARPSPRRRVRPSGAAAGAAAGRLSRRLYRAGVRHHARHRQSAVHRNAGEVSQHPLHHVAYGRRDAVPAVPAERPRRRAEAARALPGRRRGLSQASLLRRRAVGGAAVVSRAARDRGPFAHPVRHRLSVRAQC